MTVDLPPPSLRPKHVGIIMDGNGRWAQQRGRARLEGHRAGADVVRDITTFARELEIPYLTLYSFSVQNWQRPALEVAGLMNLLVEFCERERPTLMKNNIRLHSIGRRDRLPESARAAVEKLEQETAPHLAMTLTLALDYGGREELVQAFRNLGQQVHDGALQLDQVTAHTVAAALSTAALPDPDLVIRTSGEVRLSNFLLWQLAYAELHFTETLWPDFTRADFTTALTDYAQRQRRYGLTAEQLAVPLC